MTEFEKRLLGKLVEDRVITEEIALAAERLQMEQGGRIDTNLLDLRAVDEDTILKYLESVSRLKVIPFEKVQDIDKDIISLFPARLAIRYRLIPFDAERGTISLLVSDPTDIVLLEEISFLLGMDVRPFIVPDLWIEHLLCKHYKIEPNKRYEELFTLIRSKGFEVRTHEKIEEEIIKRGSSSEIGAGGPTLVIDGKMAGQQAEGSGERIVKEIVTDIEKPYVYTKEEALEDIKGIKDRDGILFYALKYAYQFFDFCGILVLKGDKIKGFNCLCGDKSVSDEFRLLELALTGGLVFKIVRDTGAHFLGVMPLNEENEMFLKRLKRPFPPNVLIVPISIAQRVIALFYADNGEMLVKGEEVPQMLTFFHIVSLQLQELIRFMKFNPPPFEVRFVSRRDMISRVDVKEMKEEEESDSTMPLPPQSVASGVESPIIADLPPEKENVEGPSGSVEPFSVEQTLSEDIVEELTQYVEPEAKKEGHPSEAIKPEAISSAEAVIEQKPPTSQEELLRKEEEYRINLLLDTLEESPNAINSPSYDELLLIKDRALPYIADRFPGRLKIDLLMQSISDISDVEEHSNLIQLIIGIGRDAIKYITPLIKSKNHTIKFYAVFIFSKLRYPEAIPYILDAIFDPSPKISLVAIDVLTKYRTFDNFSIVLSRLRTELVSLDNEKVRIAALSLGQFKDHNSVPQLIKLLSSKTESVREAALNALRDICKEDMGYDVKGWNRWWIKHQKVPRMLWLIEGLNHKDENIRYLSIEELRDITGEFFGYFYDAPKRERERSIEKWREWWRREGEKRFLQEGK